MELFGSLLSSLNGLIASTLVVLHLMAGSASTVWSAFTMRESPHAEMHVTVSSSPATTTAQTTNSAATSTAAKTQTKAAKKAAPVATPSPTPITAVNLTPLLSAEEVNKNTRENLVNILCSTLIAGVSRSISGSGVIIDARGVILTNAHIGQYFLLSQALGRSSVDCVIRIGSPAAPRYRATLLYLPPQWVENNASQIKSEHASGTGEYDYAFLLINSTTDPSGTLPASFPNILMSGATPVTGENILVAGYPAGFLDSMTIERNLYATSAYSKVGQLYTFDSTMSIDVVSLGGTVVSQGGSSGGAVVRMYDGRLSGLIATATTGTTTADRDLRAITLNYINRSLTALGKGGLLGLLNGDVQDAAATFAKEVAPSEAQKLLEALK